MKLAELQTQVGVRDATSGSSRSYFRAADDWDITFAQGIVTVRKGAVHRLIPMSNVAWMTPEEDEAADAKPKGKAA